MTEPPAEGLITAVKPISLAALEILVERDLAVQRDDLNTFDGEVSHNHSRGGIVMLFQARLKL